MNEKLSQVTSDKQALQDINQALKDKLANQETEFVEISDKNDQLLMRIEEMSEEIKSFNNQKRN